MDFDEILQIDDSQIDFEQHYTKLEPVKIRGTGNLTV